MKKTISLFFIIFIMSSALAMPAHAGTLYCQGMVCSTTPPAPESFATFAAVDSQGVVKNVILCNIANCPTTTNTDEPTCPSCSLVQQTPAGVTAGILGTSNNPVTYNANTKTFSQGSVDFPSPVTHVEVVETTTVSVTIESNVNTFGASSPVVDGQMQLTPVITDNTGASISASQNNTVETQSFNAPQTKEQVTAAVVNKPLLTAHLNKFFTLLRGWILD